MPFGEHPIVRQGAMLRCIAGAMLPLSCVGFYPSPNSMSLGGYVEMQQPAGPTGTGGAMGPHGPMNMVRHSETYHLHRAVVDKTKDPNTASSTSSTSSSSASSSA